MKNSDEFNIEIGSKIWNDEHIAKIEAFVKKESKKNKAKNNTKFKKRYKNS